MLSKQDFLRELISYLDFLDTEDYGKSSSQPALRYIMTPTFSPTQQTQLSLVAWEVMVP